MAAKTEMLQSNDVGSLQLEEHENLTIAPVGPPKDIRSRIQGRSSKLKNHARVGPAWPEGYEFRSLYTRDLYSKEKGLGLSLFRYLMRASSDALLRFLPTDGGKWLEVGCGPGGFLVRASEATSMCVGVDLDAEVLPDAAALTRNLLGSSCVARASAYSLPFGSGFFDGVVCLETVEHLDVVRFLEEASRILKPAGYFVFSVPVEVGSALLARQAIRFFLGLRSQHFAPMEYSLVDLLRMTLRIADARLYKEKHRVGRVSDHMFFSYRGFLDDLDRYFRLETLTWYPIPFPGPWSFSIHGRAMKR